MDQFVCNKLIEWGLGALKERFQEERIDTERLYLLEDCDIDNLIPNLEQRAKFKNELKFLKVQPSTSGKNDRRNSIGKLINFQRGKRKLDLQGESSKSSKQQCGTVHGSSSEEIVLYDVKNIMRHVYKRLHNQDNTKLNAFLKKKIEDLETDKKELVGVFGRTGAGKSSLINAIIGEKDLLPTGHVSACTSVMIKVETNMDSLKYEAEIEFITKEEWRDELWSLYHILGDNTDQEQDDDDDDDDDDYCDTVEKLSALYGEDIGGDWKNISLENLMDDKHFKEIPEFLKSKPKILTCKSAQELSKHFVKYTRSENQGEGKEVKRYYWPLVKCVTVRVPKNDLLQHVTLVDLPGTGDCNKGRERMWKKFIGSCSTVWIVTEIKRAESEKEAWEILESACSLMGNGGECQGIHFICTKSDEVAFRSAADVHDHILGRNEKVKGKVKREFSKLKKIKKHFSDECFEVFTVSSEEFLEKTVLDRDETEIPKLQDFLKNLNDCHSETLNYVSGAHGILSLIQGAKCRDVAGKKMDVCKNLEEKLKQELDVVRKSIEKSNEAFDRCLTEGVEKSKSSCEEMLKSIIEPKKAGGGFHPTLRCIVENSGAYKPKKRKQINLNVTLSSCLTDSIDEEFRKTFPFRNEAERGPFNGVIDEFSLNTQRLTEMDKAVELQLIFLKTEEDKIKTKLNKTIRERKKTIYNGLEEKIEETMQGCYKKAADFGGQGSQQQMRDILQTHVSVSKNTMFEEAKAAMLNQLNELKEEILGELEKTLKEAIELSLKTDDDSIPDVSDELEKVKNHYSELKRQRRITSVSY